MIKKAFKLLISMIMCSFFVVTSNIHASNFSEEKNDLSITIEYIMTKQESLNYLGDSLLIWGKSLN